MDGFGLGPKYPGNAVENTPKPHLENIFKECPGCRLAASGLDVGLPEGQMGNSEVGHTNMGAGRVVYQDLTRISKAFADGEAYKNEVLVGAMENAKDKALHLMGLLSDGGVHSLIDHLFALMKMAKEQGLSLNPTKISGACGRLMCCLAYEENAYEYLNSIMPMVGSTVRTPDGLGTVLEVNPISGYLRVRCGTEALPPRYYKVGVCEYISGGKRAPRRPDPDDDYSGVRNPAPVVASADEKGNVGCGKCPKKEK